jgi:hypothetical protein
MSIDTAVKATPAIGLKDWVEKVRTLAPEARIPYIVEILAAAYESHVSAEQFADALPKFGPPDLHWVEKRTEWIAKRSLCG